MGARPTTDALEAARERLLPDVLGPDASVWFVGINPSLYSTAVGHHFARPGNRFWPALHGAGVTDRLLDPSEDRELLRYDAGLTNLVARTTARADELDPDEITAGVEILGGKVERLRPNAIAIVGVSAYRIGFADRRAKIGKQSRSLGNAAIWALPNPSGLNAHYQLPRLIELYAEMIADVRR